MFVFILTMFVCSANWYGHRPSGTASPAFSTCVLTSIPATPTRCTMTLLANADTMIWCTPVPLWLDRHGGTCTTECWQWLGALVEVSVHRPGAQAVNPHTCSITTQAKVSERHPWERTHAGRCLLLGGGRRCAAMGKEHSLAHVPYAASSKESVRVSEITAALAALSVREQGRALCGKNPTVGSLRSKI